MTVTSDLELDISVLIAGYELANGVKVTSIEIRRTHPRVSGDDYDFVVHVNTNGRRP